MESTDSRKFGPALTYVDPSAIRRLCHSVARSESGLIPVRRCLRSSLLKYTATMAQPRDREQRDELDISAMPELRRVAEEVARTGRVRVLTENGKVVARVVPEESGPSADPDERRRHCSRPRAHGTKWMMKRSSRASTPTVIVRAALSRSGNLPDRFGSRHPVSEG